MKRILLFGWVLLIGVLVYSQDFTSIFIEKRGEDANLSRITVSPRMMEEILKCDVEKNNSVLEVISDLKSMQVISSHTEGEEYYREALKLLEKNSRRYDPLLSYEAGDKSYQIAVRKKRKRVVEIVMLTRIGNGFAIINCTGEIKPEFISALANTLPKD